jgi:uncharacterized membrane protein YhdT
MDDKSLDSNNKRKFIEDPRYKQCNKEAIYGVILGLINMAWWYIFGYGLGSKPVEEYSYILGFPSWFFISSILGAVVFTILTFIMVNKLFVDMPLDKMTKEEAEEYIMANEKGGK